MINDIISGYGLNSFKRNGKYESVSKFVSTQKEQKQKLINKQYNDIFEHEQAHKSAAGDLGGSIVIENNANGIPVGGHVNIKMPAVNKSNPEDTIKKADTVIKAAMAPKDPSAQDYRVASQAENIKSMAESEKNKSGKKLNFVA